MQHETIGIFALQRIDLLRITHAAQRRHNDSLSFATREQGGTVRARQHAIAYGDLTHGTRIATIDARLTAQNLSAHDFGFQRTE